MSPLTSVRVEAKTLVKIGQLLRYSSSKDAAQETVDGLPNYFFKTFRLGSKLPLLERGINPIARIKAPGGSRLPAVLVRSSPHKAGSATTPWQDFFETDNGHIRYFGDNRPERRSTAESAPGNRLLNSLVGELWSESANARLTATPLIFFRGAPLAGRSKGQVEFQGFGLIEQASLVTHWGAKGAGYFTNYVYDFLVFALAHENEEFDWSWINVRRDPKASDERCLTHAPESWKQWVRNGSIAIPRVRRSVAKLRVVKRSEQLPVAGSKEEVLLRGIVSYYQSRRVRFEALAEWLVGRVLGEGPARYRPGWVTRRSADGGADFVGRLDVGKGFASTRIIVFGQAKCEAFTKPTGGTHIARTVARLRRGWIGVYVTTSYFSNAVQEEIIEDQYPLILIHGRRIAEEVAKALIERRTDLTTFLGEVDVTYESRVQLRRPEEILLDEVVPVAASRAGGDAAAQDREADA